MGEDDIRNYLNSQKKSTSLTPTTRPARPRMATRRARTSEPASQDTFQNFSATHLFCPRCRQATPVREKILLYLPDGDLYEYACTVCHTSVGTRKAGT